MTRLFVRPPRRVHLRALESVTVCLRLLVAKEDLPSASNGTSDHSRHRSSHNFHGMNQYSVLPHGVHEEGEYGSHKAPARSSYHRSHCSIGAWLSTHRRRHET